MRRAKQDIKNVIFLIHNVTRLPLHVGLGFPRLSCTKSDFTKMNGRSYEFKAIGVFTPCNF